MDIDDYHNVCLHGVIDGCDVCNGELINNKDKFISINVKASKTHYQIDIRLPNGKLYQRLLSSFENENNMIVNIDHYIENIDK